MPRSTHSSNRVPWVGLARGLGIMLVVLGHTLRGLYNSSIISKSSISYIDSWIYSFHMPLFFIISGLFFSSSIANRSDKQFVLSKVSTILYPYLIWSLLFGFMQALLSRHTNSSVEVSELWQIIFDPIGHFWFLYVLLICQLMLFAFHKLRVPIFVMFVFACAYYFIGPFIPVGVMYQARTYLIFIVVGLVFSFGSNRLRFEPLPVMMLVLLSIIGLSIVSVSVHMGFQGVRWFRPIIAISGSFAIFSLAVILGRLKIAKFIETWGTMSLEIYVAHIFGSAAVRIVLQKFFHVVDPTVHIVLGVFFGIYGPILLVTTCNRLNFQWLFRFPLTKQPIHSLR